MKKQTLMKNLLDKQKEAILKLQQYKVGALFMQAGTGKTLTAVELIKSVSNIDYVLWITPFQTKDNLRKELDKCGGLDCEIVGVESLQNSDRIYLDLYTKVQNKKTFLICDESIKIKNFNAKRTKRMLELSKHCEYKLILNGTPLTRNLLDLWSQIQFLSPKILKMDLPEFKNTFCEYTKITKYMGGVFQQREFITGYHNIDYLYSLIDYYVYECDLELNIQKNYKDISYCLCEQSKEKYNYLKEKYLDNEKMRFLNNNIFIEMTQKMQHGYCCTENKFEVLENIIKDIDKSKVLIYCKYIISYEELRKRYGDIQILTYGKHSLGLNLQQYNTTIYFDKTFDYSQMVQSENRTYRTGQQENCMYYNLTGDVGLEKMINDNIKKKQSLLDYFKKVGIEQIKKEI